MIENKNDSSRNLEKALQALKQARKLWCGCVLRLWQKQKIEILLER